MEYQVDKTRRLVTLKGDVMEGVASTLDQLRRDIMSEVNWSFDCSEFGAINSVGVSAWLNFITSLPSTKDFVFYNCPANFLETTAMINAFVGDGAIGSAMALFTCPKCDVEAEHFVTAAEFRNDPELTKPCSQCGGEMENSIELSQIDWSEQPPP